MNVIKIRDYILDKLYPKNKYHRREHIEYVVNHKLDPVSSGLPHISPYPEEIKKSVHVLCEEIIKYYPEIFNKQYDNHGFPNLSGSSFQQRMEMEVYIELIKSGVKFKI